MPHAMPEQRELDTSACFQRPLSEEVPAKCKMKRSEIERLYTAETTEQLVKDVQQFEGVFVFDPNPTYCDETECDYTKGGLPVFRDVYQHASTHLNRLVGPRFEQFLQEVPQHHSDAF
jgi:hypothetical protein